MDGPRLIPVLCATFSVAIAVFTGCTAQTRSEERHNALTLLGKEIFHDRNLSIDGSVSCASCHQPRRYFTDGLATATGAQGARGTRNVPSLLDVPLVTSFFWDGRESRLDEVVLQPFTNMVEMGLPDHDALVALMVGRPAYRQLVKNAFGDEAIDADRIAQALMAHLRALPVNPTRFDLYTQSNGTSGLSGDEIAGLSLFKGKAACTDCHNLDGSPAALTDHLFHHTGIGYERVAGNISEMVRQLDALERKSLPLGQAILTDVDIAELGRFASTRRPSDLGAFRTPSLRNVALTVPYMHDGSVVSLEGAVEREIYYRSLARGRPISLTVEEQSQLVAFLKALTTELPEAELSADESFRNQAMGSAEDR